jgi:hypothetical protein
MTASPAPSGSRTADDVRAEIRGLVAEYCRLAFPERPFQPGQAVPVAGRVFDAHEVQHIVDSGLDFWLTTGRFAEEFERRFATVVGTRGASLVNSGSSANLLALTALTSHKLLEDQLVPVRVVTGQLLGCGLADDVCVLIVRGVLPGDVGRAQVHTEGQLAILGVVRVGQ